MSTEEAYRHPVLHSDIDWVLPITNHQHPLMTTAPQNIEVE
jgi:hypothetical protein